jgi:hypothetical protein
MGVGHNAMVRTPRLELRLAVINYGMESQKMTLLTRSKQKKSKKATLVELAVVSNITTIS